MAEFYMITGKYHEVIKILEDLRVDKKELLDKNNFMAAVIYLKIADAYKHLGQYNRAVSYAEKVKKIHNPVPAIHQINNFLFNLYYELGEVENMTYEYNRLKDRISKFESNYMKILLDIADNKFSSAEKEINDFCSKNQNRDKHYIRYMAILEGELAFAHDRYAVAAEKFRNAAAIGGEIYPEKVENKYAISLGLDGKLDRAIEVFQKILTKNPNNPVSLLNISQFYFEKGETLKARFYLDHFLKLWENADEDSPMMEKAVELKNRMSEN
jgi:tetratricopeptide (TPR) repeat protein